MAALTSTTDFSREVWESSSLLRTKLLVPEARPGRVPRPGLLARLDRGVEGRLTLVSAPAGFGKTTLVSEWLQQGNRSFAWLSLDEGDNDLIRFLAYFVAALQEVNGDWGQSVQAALWSSDSPVPQALVTALINDIVADRSEFLLILDDYHVISTPSIHDTLAFLLENIPPHMHLVIITRADPPLPLSRLRVQRELTEIRADDLRFSSDEAAVFLNEVMELELTPEQVAALDARTEGWVAGLQLAALSLRGLWQKRDVATFIKAFTGSHRYVMDYLIEEVFGQQPPHVQEFLMRTCILDRLSGPLCDALTGQTDGQEMLARLDQASLFTVPLDHERHWYRYHQLFADLLRDRLRQVHPEMAPELHRRASAWNEENGLMEDAVHHALKAEDFELATHLIERVAFSLWQMSKQRTLLSWMKALPEELVRSHPALGVHYAAALTVTGRLAQVEPWLHSAETQLLTEGSSADQGLLADVYRLRAYVARFVGSVPDAIRFSQRALALVPADEWARRDLALLHLGHAYFMDGNVEAAGQALIEASVAAQTIGHPAAYLSSIHYLAQLRVLQGRLGEAMAIYQQAMQFVAGQDKPVFAGIERIGVGDLLCERNDLEAASRYIQEGLRLAELGGDFVFLRDGYIARARLEQAEGHLDSALVFIQKAGQVVHRHQSSWEAAWVDAWQARLWLAQGNVSAAEHWAQTCGLGGDRELDFLHEFGHLTLARVFLARGVPGRAGPLLERLCQFARAAGRMGRVIEILVLQALTLQAREDTTGALACLERALVLAGSEGYVRVFVDEGEPMRRLLKGAAVRGIAPEGVNKLLSAFESESPPRSPGVSSFAVRGAVKPLTPREIEVLRLIAAGLRNQEIADRLVISLATVKRHISNIYGKLDVNHRTQAVVLAQELGLL